MVLRRDGWRLIASVAACSAVAGAFPPGMAVQDASAAQLRWGGPVPAVPRPGEVPVYVPSASAYASRPQPQPQFVQPAQERPEPPAEPEALDAGNREPHLPAPEVRARPEPADEPTQLYEPRIAPEAESSPGEAEEASAAPDEETALPPLGDPVDVDDGDGPAAGESAMPLDDPWSGLKAPTPGAALPGRLKRETRLPSYASLEQTTPPRRQSDPDAVPRRGALEEETPSGYTPMPTSETMCRRALSKLGVRFVDAAAIRRSRSCGIDYPVTVSDIAPGVAIRPSATLSCMAALRVAQWTIDEVKPDARRTLGKTPTVLVNASSYRCSRIAGSRSISEHASGNALDVRAFKFSDGSFVEVEKKGFFEFRQKSFQQAVRRSACRYFGTVLGPGYNEDHADHLHLDTKQRRRGVCK